jgi:hypothetical protein
LTLAPGDDPITYDSGDKSNLAYEIQPGDAGTDIHADTGFVFTPGDPEGDPQCDEKAVHNAVAALPCIEIEKDVSCLEVTEGTTVTYEFCVHNCGVNELEVTDLYDDVLGDLLGDFYTANSDSYILPPDAEVCVYVDYTITESDPDPLDNTVSVEGMDEFGQYDTDEDSASVDILEPCLNIDVECISDGAVEPGGEADFRVTLTNCGEVDLLVDVSTNLGICEGSGIYVAAGGSTSCTANDPGYLIPIDFVGSEICLEASATWVVAGEDVCLTGESDEPVTDSDCCSLLGDTFCSFTQGFWGNANGTACDPALTTAQLLDALIPPSVIVGWGANTIEFETPQDVLDGLPAGGKAKALNTGIVTYSNLPNNMLFKDGRVKNVLVGQVVALTLNLRMSPGCLPEGGSGDLAVLVLPDVFCVVPYDDPEACPKQYIIPELLVGKTVAEVLELANKALGGEELPEDITIGMLYEAASAVNEAFDECAMIVSCPTEEICDNDCDDDFDGDIDCADEDCVEDPACEIIEI